MVMTLPRMICGLDIANHLVPMATPLRRAHTVERALPLTQTRTQISLPRCASKGGNSKDRSFGRDAARFARARGISVLAEAAGARARRFACLRSSGEPSHLCLAQ